LVILFFEKQKFAFAIQKYEKALDLLKFDTNFSDEEKKKNQKKITSCVI